MKSIGLCPRLKVILIVLFFVQTLSSYSQVFNSGYIMKGSEKIIGLISYNSSDNTKSKILFKPTKSESQQEFTADEVSGFYLDRYQANFISVPGQANGARLFAEVIMNGPAVLSSHKDLYFITKDAETMELILPVGKKAKDTERKMLEIKAAGAIKNFLGECVDKQTEAKLTEVTFNTVSNVLKSYNECKGTPSVKKKGKVSVGILAGYSTGNFTTDDYRYKGLFEYEPTIKAGLSFDFMPSQFHRKIVLNLQLLYLQNNFKQVGSVPVQYQKTTIDFSVIEVPLKLKIFLKEGQDGLFISPGVGFNVPANNKNNSDIQTFKGVNATGMVGVGYEINAGKFRVVPTVSYETYLMVDPYNGIAGMGEAKSNISYLHFDLVFKIW